MTVNRQRDKRRTSWDLRWYQTNMKILNVPYLHPVAPQVQGQGAGPLPGEGLFSLVSTPG